MLDSVTQSRWEMETLKWLVSTQIRNIKGMICDQSRNQVKQATIADFTHLKNSKYNLFSKTKMTQKEWILGGNENSIWLKKGTMTFMFDIKISTPKRVLFAMYHTQELGGLATEAKLSITKVHRILGNRHKQSNRDKAKALGWELTRGTLGPCDACTVAKAKQKNLPRHPDQPPASKDENCMYLDLSTIRKVKGGPIVYNGNWRMLVDERTLMKFSNFYNTKNGMIEPTCERL